MCALFEHLKRVDVAVLAYKQVKLTGNVQAASVRKKRNNKREIYEQVRYQNIVNCYDL